MSPRRNLTPSAPRNTAAPRMIRSGPSRSVTVPISWAAAASGSNRAAQSTSENLRIPPPSIVVGRTGQKVACQAVSVSVSERPRVLVRQADFLQQLLKARIGAQGVVDRINLQSGEGTGMLQVRLLQPSESLILVVDRDAGDKHGRRINLTLAVDLP